VAEDGALVATPAALQDSSMLATLARAEALVLRAPHAPALAAGSAVEVVVLAELGV
jgi:molybdopterin molybdotransferase